MATIFNVNQTFPDSGGVPTLTPVYAAKQGDNGVQGVVTAGPNSDPNTTIAATVQLNRNDGNGWVDVGGVYGNFGLIGPKGGPYDQPVTITATTYCALARGWQVRGSVLVVGTPVTLAFQGNTF